MESPNWLPPLNSHNQYDIYVKASQPGAAERVQSLEVPHFSIQIKLSVNFYSDNSSSNIERCFEGLNMEKYFTVPCHEVTRQSVSSWETISSILYSMYIPFEFDEAIWRERHLNTNFMDEATTCCKLYHYMELLEKIREFLACMKIQVHNVGKNRLPFKLEMEKMVTIPDQELKDWNAWYDEKRKSNPNFEREFQEAIKRQRTDEELIYETSLAFRGATRSAIQELEEVKLDYLSSRSSCAICLEELQMGSQGIRLPCSHIFHRDCIFKWLQQSHMCPLCRYMLPTAPVIDDHMY